MMKENKVTLNVSVPEIGLTIPATDVCLELGKYGDVPLIEKRDTYEGDYAVTPSTSEQRLATANKVLEQDVVIKEIPYSEVSNLAGGNTVYIGKVEL